MANAEQQRIAGEYVLGTLSAASRAQVQARMQREPELAAAVRAWEARLQPLTQLAAAVTPSDQLWPRIAQSVARAVAQRQAASSAARPQVQHSPLQRWWNNLSLWRGAAGLSFAASLLMGTLLLTRVQAPPAPQYMVVLVAAQDKAPGFVMQAASAQRVRLIPLGVAQIPADKALELWTHVDGAKPATSLGVIKPGQPFDLDFSKFPIKPDMPFAISLEPPTGSPTGQPTGPVLYSGKAVKI
jgi:anti-sigma-K factor RskA